jgi:hypothetical protein
MRSAKFFVFLVKPPLHERLADPPVVGACAVEGGAGRRSVLIQTSSFLISTANRGNLAQRAGMIAAATCPSPKGMLARQASDSGGLSTSPVRKSKRAPWNQQVTEPSAPTSSPRRGTPKWGHREDTATTDSAWREMSKFCPDTVTLTAPWGGSDPKEMANSNDMKILKWIDQIKVA